MLAKAAAAFISPATDLYTLGAEYGGALRAGGAIPLQMPHIDHTHPCRQRSTDADAVELSRRSAGPHTATRSADARGRLRRMRVAPGSLRLCQAALDDQRRPGDEQRGVRTGGITLVMRTLLDRTGDIRLAGAARCLASNHLRGLLELPVEVAVEG